jgi:hypothetical protein
VWFSFGAFFTIGVGMGFVALSTLLVVQSWLSAKDLGVATASNQLARTLGGTVGVGVCGSLMAARLSGLKAALGDAGILDRLPDQLAAMQADHIGEMLRPEIQVLMPPIGSMRPSTDICLPRAADKY